MQLRIKTLFSILESGEKEDITIMIIDMMIRGVMMQQ